MADLFVKTIDVTKSYGDHRVLDRVGLTVRRGEIYGFLGPNGAGKTTTLRILLGLVKPSAGTVRVMGAEPGNPGALSRIGMLMESAAFYPYLSGRDNLRAMARYCRIPDARVDEVIELIGLSDRSGDRFAAYSLGMKQRLGLAAALLKDPDLLILDEPTNGLDPVGMAGMRLLIRRLGKEGRTVLLSSHLLDEVQQTCDRVGMIARGELLRESTVDELRGTATLMVVPEPLGRARALVEAMLGAERVTVYGTTLRLRADAETAVRINRELVLAGIAVRTLTWEERSLEDVFFEVTGTRQPNLTGSRGGA